MTAASSVGLHALLLDGSGGARTLSMDELAAWQPGRSAVLVRNPAYHGQFTGNVQHVEVSLLADLSERLALYEADGLDFFRLCDLPAVELDRARHRHACL